MAHAHTGLAAVTLDDKYVLERGRVYLTGTQALVRLPMMQKQRDAAAGLNTAGFISGYRGSPLGNFDRQLWEAKQFLARSGIHFQPGLNEDLAATAVWGSQQVGLYQDRTVDGVFAIWYGKGPGVDRCGDVFKHANSAGSSTHGGVLVLAGDDHNAKSSTLPHQSEYAFMDASIPVLHPAGVQEILDFGLIGWAMSRYSGLWVAMKTIAETVDSSASVDIDPARVHLVTPTDFALPEGGVNIRWPDPFLPQEYRLHRHKLYAALAFARANKIDRIVIDSPRPRLGIVTTGKAYLDVRQAFDDLGIDDQLAAEIGIRVYKVGMTWPLEREGVRHFAEGLEEILVVEEKRAVIENQLKEQLYNWREDVRPRVIGKFDEAKSWILPSAGELNPAQIARIIAQRIARFYESPRIHDRLAFLEAKERQLARLTTVATRTPTFCSGCPHNSSTKVPDGSRAMAGIGCHFMAVWMDRQTETFSQMGGEGVAWLGQHRFVATDHVFVNLGDGTYYHSGHLAIRAAIAGQVKVTYKILFNDAVAMTGGQPHDGPLSVPQIARAVAAEGVERIAIVSDEPDKYPIGAGFPGGVTFHHRNDLDAVQRDLRDWPGVSVLIYDQTCATEKRRRRKRGLMVDPPIRVVINEQVCEGCGDCGVQSNCVSIQPVETEFGRKRQIDQSTCNKDFSCVRGFCPSFVTIEGGRPRKPAPAGTGTLFTTLPAAAVRPLDGPYNILVTGVGGTGVVTIGALLGMAAHLEGKGCSVLDMMGLAQKGGAVFSHIRIAPTPEDIHAVRIAAGQADLLIGADLVTSATQDGLSKLKAGRTRAVINDQAIMTADFTRKPDLPFARDAMEEMVRQEIAAGDGVFFDAGTLAARLVGDSIGANPLLLGFAAQKGWLPVSTDALERAIELNAVAVAMNLAAFRWGRLAAVDFAAVEAAARPAPSSLPAHRLLADSLAARIERRVATLTAYQNAAYARLYADLVDRVRRAEVRATGGEALTEAVAVNAFKLMAYKDEYEVARLMSDPAFLTQIAAQFEGDWRLAFNLAPPLLAETGSDGRPVKRRFGRWMLPVFRVLARLKGLRGTRFDPFGHTEERRMERRLIAEYMAMIDEMLPRLTPATAAPILALARLPEQVRGYGPVKLAAVAKMEAAAAALRAQVTQAAGGTALPVAAE